jgi:hypothetical protein
MNALAPCPSCRRHVRVVESACPFCGSAVALGAIAPRGVYGQRLGRAALFTFGAAIATTAGCGTSTTPSDAGTSPGIDAGDVADVGNDADYGSIHDAYGTPAHDVGPMFPDAGTDAGASAPDTGTDAGFVAPYGTPPPPPRPPER